MPGRRESLHPRSVQVGANSGSKRPIERLLNDESVATTHPPGLGPEGFLFFMSFRFCAKLALIAMKK